jgi:hypothetical protein
MDRTPIQQVRGTCEAHQEIFSILCDVRAELRDSSMQITKLVEAFKGDSLSQTGGVTGTLSNHETRIGAIERYGKLGISIVAGIIIGVVVAWIRGDL